MSGETKKIVTFVATGIVAAMAIGLLVWRLSTPTERVSAETEYGAAGQGEATQTQQMSASQPTSASEGDNTESTDTQTTSKDSDDKSTRATRTSSLNAAEGRGHDKDSADDPFLPPHAVGMADPKANDKPQRVYRPDNITAAEPNLVAEEATPKPAGKGSTPEESEGSGSAVAVATDRPVQPIESEEPTESEHEVNEAAEDESVEPAADPDNDMSIVPAAPVSSEVSAQPTPAETKKETESKEPQRTQATRSEAALTTAATDEAPDRTPSGEASASPTASAAERD